MKKTCKKLVSLLLTLVITLSVLTVAPFAVSAADENAEQVGGVQDTLNSILSVYPTGSYFTASGNVCYSNSSNDCKLSNIPSRGGLPSGSSVAAVTGNAWSCCSFARYVFYCTFGVSPESCSTVSSSNAQIGDYMNLGTHYAIYLGQDSTYWYVYDSNYTSPPTNVVKYNRALKKSNFSSVKIHHAPNYSNNSNLPEPVDLGTDFYAYIINTYAWKHLTNVDLNVVMNSETGAANQVWYFQRQSDSTYKITNCLDGRALDVHNFGTTDGTNVAVCESNESTAQRWFITGESGAYYFRAACGDLVLDIEGGSTSDNANVQMWTKNDSTAQKFQVWKLSEPSQTFVHCAAGTNYRPTSIWWLQTDNTRYYDVKIWKNSLWEGEAYKILWGVTDTSCMVNLPAGYYEAYVDTRNNYSTTMSSNIVKFTVTEGEPENIGEDFYAALLVNKNWVNVSNVNSNVELAASNHASAEQIWHFMRQSDGSYIIVNCLDGNALDVSNAENNNGTNVQVHEINYTDAQKWYIYGRWSGEYYLKPKCADKVLDVSGGNNVVGDNIQIWELNYSDAQKFAVYEVESVEKSEVSVESIINDTCFNWTKANNANEYEVKIWKEASINGEPFMKYNTSDTRWNVVLPIGNYIACVYSKNSFSRKQSNLVTFTVEYTNAIGDVDGDGIISVSDATALQKQLANGVEFDDEMLAVADTNGDGIVSVSDATLIQKYLAGNASSLG